MKKNIIFSIFISISLLFVACSKTPFKKEEPLKGAALVYIYVTPGNSINEIDRIPYYEVRINGKNTEGKIYPHEFLKYNLDADSVEISVARDVLEKKSLTINLTRGETYYLRVKSYADGFAKFDFELVPSEKALQEIKDTKYAVYENAETLGILVKEDVKKENKEVKENSAEKSKTDKIKEAFELKKEGIITEDEFKKLKAEILDAD